MKVALLLMLTACLGGRGFPDGVHFTPTGNAHEKMVYAVDQFLVDTDFEQSLYWRPGDQRLGPTYLVIAVDRTACIVSGEVWTVARAGSYVTCETSWRQPRP